MKKKNIIMLLIDSMSQEDLNYIKLSKDKFPGFNYLVRDSIEFKNTYSVSSPTEAVLPSIFTSTLPLQNKTYEYGINHRNKDLIDIIEKNNYRLNLFSNVPVMSSLYGYNYNNTNLKYYFSINAVWKHFVRNYVWHLKNSKIFHNNYYDKFEELIERYYPFFIEVIKKDNTDLTSMFLRKRDKSKIIENIKTAHKIFRKDKLKYYNDNINKILKYNFYEYFGFKSYKYIFLNYISKKLKRTKQGWKDGRINLFDYQISFNNFITDSKTLFKELINTLDQKSKKTFNFIHILDLHYYKTGENLFINKINRDRDINNQRLRSLKYIDEQIVNLLSNIKKKEDYTFVITSDHGTIDLNGTGPLTTKLEEGVFKNEFIQIPFFIKNSDIKIYKNKEEIISSVNLIPIILHLNNMDINNKIKKLALIKKGNIIISEHTHRGSSYENISKGIIYIAIINKYLKLIIKKNKSEFDLSPYFKKKFFNNNTNKLKYKKTQIEKDKKLFLKIALERIKTLELYYEKK
jgi:arylsulfatase A-like enzyme